MKRQSPQDSTRQDHYHRVSGEESNMERVLGPAQGHRAGQCQGELTPVTRLSARGLSLPRGGGYFWGDALGCLVVPPHNVLISLTPSLPPYKLWPPPCPAPPSFLVKTEAPDLSPWGEGERARAMRGLLSGPGQRRGGRQILHRQQSGPLPCSPVPSPGEDQSRLRCAALLRAGSDEAARLTG